MTIKKEYISKKKNLIISFFSRNMMKILIWIVATICSCKCFLAFPNNAHNPRSLKKRNHGAYESCASIQQLEGNQQMAQAANVLIR